jgi:hypothetical protein
MFNRTAKSMDLILSPKCCTIVPAKIQPTPKRKEQEHRVCEVSVVPRPGMARMAISMAIETPACQGKISKEDLHLQRTYQGDLTFRLAAETIDKRIHFHSIQDAVNRSTPNAPNRDWHAQHHSCRIAHENKKFTRPVRLSHRMASNKTGFRLIVAVQKLVVPYVV